VVGSDKQLTVLRG